RKDQPVNAAGSTAIIPFAHSFFPSRARCGLPPSARRKQNHTQRVRADCLYRLSQGPGGTNGTGPNAEPVRTGDVSSHIPDSAVAAVGAPARSFPLRRASPAGLLVMARSSIARWFAPDNLLRRVRGALGRGPGSGRSLPPGKKCLGVASSRSDFRIVL